MSRHPIDASEQAFLRYIKPLISSGDTCALNSFFNIVYTNNVLFNYITALWIIEGTIKNVPKLVRVTECIEPETQLPIKSYDYETNPEPVTQVNRLHLIAYFFRRSLLSARLMLPPKHELAVIIWLGQYFEIDYNSDKQIWPYVPGNFFSESKKFPLANETKKYHALKYYIRGAQLGSMFCHTKIQQHANSSEAYAKQARAALQAMNVRKLADFANTL